MSRAGSIDGLRFARERGVVAGTLDLADLPRVAELGGRAGRIRFTVRGGESARRRLCLEVSAQGVLVLQCQRCLEPVDLAVDQSVELELSASEREIAMAEDGVDRVLAHRSMDVAALVEDELILALPMVPMHERCEPAGRAQAGTAEADPDTI
jgi:uncharacterized protein